ncbi:adenylate/guanylate cyclase domain-containing protein, partial [Azospirillum formosense]
MEKPLALLFVDIADSTLLYELAGDRKAAALTQRVLEGLRRIVGENGGTVVKSLGDGLLACFPISDGATRAALAMMERQVEFGPRLRAGLHYGPEIAGPRDPSGTTSTVADRRESIAPPGVTVANVERGGRIS